MSVGIVPDIIFPSNCKATRSFNLEILVEIVPDKALSFKSNVTNFKREYIDSGIVPKRSFSSRSMYVKNSSYPVHRE